MVHRTQEDAVKETDLSNRQLASKRGNLRRYMWYSWGGGGGG